jgi:predicted DsbA family dithiol-disulfide isomerase
VSYGNKELVNRYGIRLKGEDYRQVMIGRLGGGPYFVIHQEISLSGLQSPDEFITLFEKM